MLLLLFVAGFVAAPSRVGTAVRHRYGDSESHKWLENTKAAFNEYKDTTSDWFSDKKNTVETEKDEFIEYKNQTVRTIRWTAAIFLAVVIASCMCKFCGSKPRSEPGA